MFDYLYDLYRLNSKKFIRVAIFLVVVAISTGLVNPYFVLVQNKYISLDDLSLLYGITYGVGVIYTLLLISGKISFSLRNRLLFETFIMFLGRFTIVLLELSNKLAFVYISVLSGFVASIYFTDIYYYVLKRFSLTNKMKSTIFYTVFLNSGMLTGYLLTKVLSSNISLLFSISSTLILSSVILLTNDNETIERNGFNYALSIYSNNKIEIIILILLSIALSLSAFIQPVIFNQYVNFTNIGLLYIISSLISIFIVPIVIKVTSYIKGNMWDVVLLTIMTFVIVLTNYTINYHIFNPFIILTLLSPAFTITRHNVFKNIEIENIWLFTTITGLITQMSKIFISILKFIRLTNVFQVYLLIEIFVIASASIILSIKFRGHYRDESIENHLI